ncbi:MAG: histone H1 [Pseudomonadota bacterium]|nr:histone H1 [Pseudomonadota bacterium]
MPRKDINQIAFDVVRQATGEATPPVESAKAKSGRKGGLKGGAARAATLSATERSAIAKKAAHRRWSVTAAKKR